MIKTTTYISAENHDIPEKEATLLEAFTSVDRTVAKQLEPSRIEKLFKRLLLRLCSLYALHGPNVAKDFLLDLDKAGHHEVFDLANAYLELGKRADGSNVHVLSARELQQEFLHFSRIVDISHHERIIGTRRIWRSKRLPNSLKVLSELMIVARSRFAQRGREMELPAMRRPSFAEQQIDETTSVTMPSDSPDYMLLVSCPRARLRKEAHYQFANLLSYLTPQEAATALSAYLAELEPAFDVSLCLLTTSTTHARMLTWSHDSKKQAANPIHWCLSRVPQITVLCPDSYDDDTVGSGGVRTGRRLDGQSGDSLFQVAMQANGQTDYTAVVCSLNGSLEQKLRPACSDAPDLGQLADIASWQLLNRIQDPIASIEFGHLHLDRAIDTDQEAGIKIGLSVFDALKNRQTTPPLLTPMIDDDHVLIRLSPKDYDRFFRSRVGSAEYHLIPESSPIIRAIAVALFGLLRESRAADALKQVGANLYINLDDGSFCELFEDLTNRCDTGCVFFETALLLYRSAPAVFWRYFHQRYCLNDNIHDKVFDMLSQDLSHDAKFAQVRDFYRQFRDVTNPAETDPGFLKLVRTTIQNMRHPLVHLNILEDYYEVQQNKVRKLIEVLDLPVRLVSLHFSVFTRRVEVAL